MTRAGAKELGRRMPNIKWCGNKPWDTEFPEQPLPENAAPLLRPENIFKASLVYGLPPLLLCWAVLGLKWGVLGPPVVNPLYMPLGLALGMALIPVHEYLHAVCYSAKNTVYVGVCAEKLAAFAVCHEPISKRRFIGMSLAPALLGIVPLAVFLLASPSALLSGLCVPSGIIGMLSPMPDYMDVWLVLRQLPRGATLQTTNQGYFWYL